MAKKSVRGLNKVLGNLNREVNKIENKGIDGLLAAGFILERVSNKIVPIEHGFLRNSSFTRKAQNNRKAVEVGYSAKYAVYVHENLEQKLKGKRRPSGLGVYWGPKGEPQFLLKSILSEKNKMLTAIQRKAKVRR